MGFAIMRIAKIKAKSSFAAIERHDRERDRLKHRKNAHRASENRWLQNKYYDKEKTLTERFESLTEGCPKWRKDAVLGFEVVMAYSPEAAASIPEREWISANLKWVSNTFGGAVNCIGAFYHCDETTPHMHVIVVPVVHDKDKDTKKLSAYHYVHGKVSLSQMQDSYAEVMQQFDLKRGNRYLDNPEIPSAHHTTLKEHWASVDAQERAELEKIKAEVFRDDFESR